MSTSEQEQGATVLFAGPGEIRATCRSIDWSATPLGPVCAWPGSLRLAVRMCLDARFPMAIWAGPECVLIYNDGYPPVLGPAKHPWALGRRAVEAWAEIWEQLGPELDKVIRQGESTHHEDERFVLRRGPGGSEEEAFFTYSFTPIQEDDGQVVGALHVFLETTDRVRALRTHTALVHAITDSSPDSIVAKDLNGRVLFANPAALALVGKPAEAVLGKTTLELFDDQGFARQSMELDRSIIESGLPRQFEQRLCLADGAARVWLVLKTPWRDAVGCVIGVLSIARDISDRQLVEDALHEAFRRQTDFIAVLSHELRNPLAPIRSSLEVLVLAGSGAVQTKRAVQVIERQTQILTRLIDDLLDVTRISSGKFNLEHKSINLAELARRTAEDHRAAFTSNGIELTIKDEVQSVFVMGDSTRLAQVIGNLLSNAAKFTPAGGQTVLSVEANEHGEALIRVQDTGAGMSRPTLEHIFEPFIQAAQTIERSRGGLGLGLALVKGLVEMHGGTVKAFSPGEGQGSEFLVILPLSVRAFPAVSPAAPSPTSHRILVVEDNRDAAESLGDVLDFEGHEVRIAYSGSQGLELARSFKPDVVFSDIGLPGLDGYGVARAVRADPDPAVRSIFLVALSGYALPEDHEKSKDAGFDRHLAKPATLEALKSVIAEAPRHSPA